MRTLAPQAVSRAKRIPMVRILQWNQPTKDELHCNVQSLSEQELWKRFRERKLLVYRDELFRRYDSLAITYASRYQRHHMPYRPLLDYDDILSYARFGLLDAIHSYRPDKGTTFKTWSFTRIRGAIIDGLRTMQDFSRVISILRRKICPLQEQLEHELCRRVTVDEVIDRFPDYKIGKTLILKDFRGNALIDASVFNQRAVEENKHDKELYWEIEQCLYRQARSRQLQLQAKQSLNRSDLIQIILTYLEDPQERQVIFLYYFSGMTYPKIAKTTGIGKTMISLKRMSALERLRIKAKNDSEFYEHLIDCNSEGGF